MRLNNPVGLEVNISKRFAIVALLILAACTNGGDFSLPDPGSLMLGETTRQQAIAQLGEGTPYSREFSGQKVDALSYWFMNPEFDLDHPRRTMHLYFQEDLLVGYYFQSSFGADSTNFDHTKRSKIRKNEDSCDEVIGLLGPPSGEGVIFVTPSKDPYDNFFYDLYISMEPVVGERETRKLLYSYSDAEFRGVRGERCWKYLEITCNEPGLVTDIRYVTNPPGTHSIPFSNPHCVF